MKKIYYSWKEFEQDCRMLANTYKKYGNIVKNIYAVPRGGLVFGVKLSHLTGLPMIFDKNKIGKKTLIVDDILDSGKTLEKLLYKKQYFNIVTPWYNGENQSKLLVVYSRMKTNKEWIVFPWETTESSKYDNK